MSLPKLFLIFSISCFFIGSLLIWQRNNPSRLTFNKFPNSSDFIYSPKANSPASITINDLNISLPIIPAKIYKRKWGTTTKGVSWLSSTPIPGNPGNSVLYGHNWSNILGNLNRAKSGQEIRILFNDKSIKKFIINSIAVVRADQASVLDRSNDIRITLYTCTGFFDEKRLVITALLVL